MFISPVSEQITALLEFFTSPLIVTSSAALIPEFRLIFPVRSITPSTSIGLLMLMFNSSIT
jgi:hypothetical protein